MGKSLDNLSLTLPLLFFSLQPAYLHPDKDSQEKNNNIKKQNPEAALPIQPHSCVHKGTQLTGTRGDFSSTQDVGFVFSFRDHFGLGLVNIFNLYHYCDMRPYIIS